MPASSTSLRGVPLLALALSLGACSAPDAGFMGGMWQPFSGRNPSVTSDSLTVQRVRGSNPAVAPLIAEPGNVWPEGDDAPRATLANPDEAMRGIPAYAPNVPGATPAQPAPGPRRGIRGSAGTPAEPIPLGEAPRAPATDPLFPNTPPPRRADGRSVTLPDGRQGVTTGGTDRVQGFTIPGQGSGSIVRDGRVETIIGPDGQVQQRIR